MIHQRPFTLPRRMLDAGARLLLRRPRVTTIALGDSIALVEERGADPYQWARVVDVTRRPVRDLTIEDLRSMGRHLGALGGLSRTRLAIAKALRVRIDDPVVWITFKPEAPDPLRPIQESIA